MYCVAHGGAGTFICLVSGSLHGGHRQLFAARVRAYVHSSASLCRARYHDDPASSSAGLYLPSYCGGSGMQSLADMYRFLVVKPTRCIQGPGRKQPTDTELLHLWFSLLLSMMDLGMPRCVSGLVLISSREFVDYQRMQTLDIPTTRTVRSCALEHGATWTQPKAAPLCMLGCVVIRAVRATRGRSGAGTCDHDDGTHAMHMNTGALPSVVMPPIGP
ncbi:hypothetical protein K466DRAFT_119175 [Polyporus arcularius HHB13444]|uniref:Uncharacterized protein n=1 Tax=Polyporus arcularius HHB13444 TaxID=1314778 RepID=A0A5C3PYF2_9APHY|nr:hypothetical protein K466DRAFT_119175 [Polyporus arcularius HHB13444]